MKIIEPKVVLWPNVSNDNVTHIAQCARVCYASNSIKNEEKFVDSLWRNKHRSMYRHAPVYFIIPERLYLLNEAYIDAYIVLYRDKYYVSTNMQTAKEYFGKYKKYIIDKEEAENIEVFHKYKMLRYTFCIETGIDISREYNRKSPNNISEQSTRYVDFNKKIGIRFKKCHWMNKLNYYKRFLTWFMCKTTEWFYKLSRSKYGLNLKPEDARWILPLDTMTKVIYTYTVKDWERIINMRLYDWTGKAHPDAKIVAAKIKEYLEDEGYNIVNYKNEESKNSTL